MVDSKNSGADLSDSMKNQPSFSENVKLAFFLPSLGGGGAERVVLTLASNMAARGYVVDLILASARGPYCKDVPSTVNVVDLHARRVLTSLPGLIRYLRRERPTALLATIGHANVIALLARCLSRSATRIVVREANTIGHTPRLKSFVMRPLMRFLYPRAEAVIAVSQRVAEDLNMAIRGVSGKLKVIHNPVVDKVIFQRAACSVVHPWFQPNNLPVIISAGRLVPQKDFSTLLHAFAEVVTKVPCRLVIFGEGPERSLLETLIRELGLTEAVDLPGFVENPFAFMSRAKLFVLSSAWEGLPNALIQALALGTPVVATDCPSGPREILDDGRLGELVPVGDGTAMAQAICRCLSKSERTHCPETWQKQFSVQTITDAYLETLLGDDL